MRRFLWLAGLIPAVLGLVACLSSATSLAWQYWQGGKPSHPVVAGELLPYENSTLDAATAAQICPQTPSWTLVTAFPFTYRGRCVFISGRVRPEDRTQPFVHLILVNVVPTESQVNQAVLLDLRTIKDRAKFWQDIDVTRTISAVGTLQGIRDESPLIWPSDLYSYPVLSSPPPPASPSPPASVVPTSAPTPATRYPSPSPQPPTSTPLPATTVVRSPTSAAVATCVERVNVQPAFAQISGGRQYLLVQALTNNGVPVAGAEGTVQVDFGGGHKDIALRPTGADGTTYAVFDVGSMSGEVLARVTLTSGTACSAMGTTQFLAARTAAAAASAAIPASPSATGRPATATPSPTTIPLTATPTASPSPPTATPSPTPLALQMVSVPVGSSPVALAVDWNPSYAGGRGGGLAYVVNEGSDSVSVVNWSQGRVIATIPVGHQPSAVLRDQNIYVLNHGSDTVSILDQNTWKPIGLLKVGHLPVAMREVFGPKLIVVNQGSSNISNIDEITRQTLATIPLGSNPSSIDGDEDQYLYVANTGSDTVSILSQALGRVLATVPVGKSPIATSSDSYGSYLLVVNRDSDSVSVIDPTLARTRPALAVEITLPVGHAPVAIAETPQHGLAYVANSGSNSLTVIDTQHFNIVSTLHLDHSPAALYPDASGFRVYVTYRDSNTITVIDTSAMNSTATPHLSQLGPLAGHPVALTTPADRLFVVTSNPDAVTMIDLSRHS